MAINTLYYAHDPMCSWCWAFRPTWAKVKAGLDSNTQTRVVMGGLAPDSSEPMPANMQASLQATWQHIIKAVPGTQFNFDFWQDCRPRRSTYPACRAVIAARLQNSELEEPMIFGIQQAYYLKARNPSDDDVLISISKEIGCNDALFAEQLNSDEVKNAFSADLNLCRQLGARGFPSLLLHTEDSSLHAIAAEYNDPDSILRSVNAMSRLRPSDMK